MNKLWAAATRVLADREAPLKDRHAALRTAARLDRLEDALQLIGANRSEDPFPGLAKVLGSVGYGFGDPRPEPKGVPVAGAVPFFDGAGWLQLDNDRVIRRGDALTGRLTEVARLPPLEYPEGFDLEELYVSCLQLDSSNRRLLVGCYYLEDDEDRTLVGEVSVLDISTSTTLLSLPPRRDLTIRAATRSLDAVIVGDDAQLHQIEKERPSTSLPGPDDCRCYGGAPGPGPHQVTLHWVGFTAALAGENYSVLRCYDTRDGSLLCETPSLLSSGSQVLVDPEHQELRAGVGDSKKFEVTIECFDGTTGEPTRHLRRHPLRSGYLRLGPGDEYFTAHPGKGIALPLSACPGPADLPALRSHIRLGKLESLHGTWAVPRHVGGHISLTDLSSGAVLTRPETHRDSVHRLGVAQQDGRAVLVSVARFSGERRVWDLGSGAAIAAWVEGPAGARLLANRRLIRNHWGGLQLQDQDGVPMSEVVYEFDLPRETYARQDTGATLASDGVTALATGPDEAVCCDLATGLVRWRYRLPRTVREMLGTFLEDRSVVLSTWNNSVTELFFLDPDGRLLWRRKWSAPTNRAPLIHAGSDPKWIVCETGRRAFVVDVHTQQSRFFGNEPELEVSALGLTEDQRRIVAITSGGGVRVEDLATGEALLTTRLPPAEYRALAVLPGDREIAVASGVYIRRCELPELR